MSALKKLKMGQYYILHFFIGRLIRAAFRVKVNIHKTGYSF